MPDDSRKRNTEVVTYAPQSTIDPVPLRIKKDNRDSLGYDLTNQILQGLADRENFNINLDYYNDLYEMYTTEKQTPWPNSSNVFVPLVPKVMDTIAARLAAVVFQPRFFLVAGNTPQASATQAVVERFYNAELARYNWTEKFFQWMNLGLRDGVGILEILWKREVVARRKLVFSPVIDEESGLQKIDPDTQTPVSEPQVKMVTDVVHDAVELTPVPLKDFVMFPSWAKSIDQALAVARVVWLAEDELDKMVRAGTLWRDAVEEALSFTAEGNNERPRDIQGYSQITANEQINISEGTVNGSPYKRQRGPLKLWRVHTRQYDFDNDGTVEEAVCWIHEASQRCLGVQAYAYWHGKRPFVGFVPMPRSDIYYGFSVPERLRTIQEELNTKENQRNDAIDRAICPPLVANINAKLMTQDMRYGPDALWETDDPANDVRVLAVPDVPLSTWQETANLENMADGLLGISAPLTGGGTSSRRTAKEIQMQTASAGVRLDLIAERLRTSIREAFWQIHELNLQYGPDVNQVNTQQGGLPERLVVDKATLAQDYDFAVAGQGGPLDKQGRAQDMMIVYTLMMKNPLVATNLERIWESTQLMLEAHDLANIQALIGTREEAAQQQQQMQAAQAAQAQQAAVMGGQPGQQQRPGQQQPQGAGPAAGPSVPGMGG